ncbi:SGNH/GDSL hydrolase family protein [Paeniglutamicibacter gangotriensis]|uniref:SGNH/GDSL hydrolase family protein n=1 Tax=Paeniglutamicibacter gangotriensis TaxID=254787 RepID=UPI0037C75D46
MSQFEALAATKPVAVQVTTSVAGYEEGANQGNIRYPFRLPVDAQMVRVCVANRNDATEQSYSGSDIRINQQIYIGGHKFVDGEMSGQFDAPPTPANEGGTKFLVGGTPYYGEWTPVSLKAGKEYLLSMSFANPPADGLASGMGTCWMTAPTGDVNKLDVAGLSKRLKSIFQVWIEVMVPKRTPTLAWIGDSTLVAREARAAVHDSPAWFHSMAHGVIPRLYGIAGSRITTWTETPDGTKWTRLSHLGRCDAAVIQIGANDVFDFRHGPDELLPTMKARLAELVPLIRRHVADRIYLTTPKGRSVGPYSAAFYQALEDWKDYLRTLPHGAEGCFDAAAAVADPNDPNKLNPIYAGADDVHLTTGGGAALGLAVTAAVALPAGPDSTAPRVEAGTVWRPVTVNPGFSAQGTSSKPSVTTDPANPNRRDMRWGFSSQGMAANGEFVVGRVPSEDIPANSYYCSVQTSNPAITAQGSIVAGTGNIIVRPGPTLASWYLFDQVRWYVR